MTPTPYTEACRTSASASSHPARHGPTNASKVPQRRAVFAGVLEDVVEDAHRDSSLFRRAVGREHGRDVLRQQRFDRGQHGGFERPQKTPDALRELIENLILRGLLVSQRFVFLGVEILVVRAFVPLGSSLQRTL
jgi:hypothetical protein